jgi:hypothetical protein
VRRKCAYIGMQQIVAQLQLQCIVTMVVLCCKAQQGTYTAQCAADSGSIWSAEYVLRAEQAAQDAMPSSSDSDSDLSSSSNVNSSSGAASQSRQLLNSGSHIVSRVSNTYFHLLSNALHVF